MAAPAYRAGALLDRLIGIFSPDTELRRLLRRGQNLRESRRQYAAAKVSRTVGGWVPLNQDPNSIIGASSRQVNARVSQLVRDFPYFIRAQRVLTNLSVADGIRLQAQVPSPDGKGLNTDLNKLIEEYYYRWAEEADVSGHLHLHEMQRLSKDQDFEAGEFLIVKARLNDPGRVVPLALQIYEPGWLSDFGATAKNPNHAISQGVEYHKSTGRPMAYHLSDPNNYGKVVRFDAADVLHGFKVLRPGQLRGISPMVSAVLLAHDMHEYMESEMDAARTASKFLGVLQTEQPGHVQAANNVTMDSATGTPTEELENAIIQYLKPGETLELKSHARPSNLEVVHKYLLRALAMAADLSYELVSGDYSGLSYSNLRGIRMDVARQITTHSQRHVRQECTPIYYAFLDDLVLANNKVDIPDYFQRRAFYQRHSFIPPGMEDVDPLRTGKAQLDQVSALLRSPQEILLARGRDPEEVLRDIQRWKKMVETAGLEMVLPQSKTNLAQNPAAMGAKT